jgi:hypothetical protein
MLLLAGDVSIWFMYFAINAIVDLVLFSVSIEENRFTLL